MVVLKFVPIIHGGLDQAAKVTAGPALPYPRVPSLDGWLEHNILSGKFYH